MKICKTCKGNNFVRLKFEGEEFTENCPDCTIDGKKEFPDFTDRVEKGKSLPPINTTKLLS